MPSFFKRFGKKGPAAPAYDVITKKCLKKGIKWEDPDFLANDETLFYSKKPPAPFEWKRPGEICDDPQLFVGGASRFDVVQGMLGDCWLLAAVASLTTHQTLLHRVLPPDQDFESGCIKFNIWQYGKWTEVLVDDRLPTYKNKLVFMHSSEKNEFWTALLEKAYAKLCGSYESLKGGQTSEAMEDFTGGVCEAFNLSKPPPNFFKILYKGMNMHSLMGCSIEAKPNEIEAKLDNGLIKGHAYSLLGIKKVKTNNGEVEMVRIRNPWGNEKEWTGAWSDGSAEWDSVPAAELERLKIADQDDGEFWMSFEDFLANFSKVEMCLLEPGTITDNLKREWSSQENNGSWQNEVSAGGCRNFPDSFHTNPQYIVELDDPDDDDEVDNCTIIIALMQKHRRKMKATKAISNLTMGFSIYKLNDDADQYKSNDSYVKEFFLYNKSTARSPSFVNSRAITGRFSLPPGKYAIIPSTFKPQENGDFLLRIYSEKSQQPASAGESGMIDVEDDDDDDEDDKKNPEVDEKLQAFFDQIAGEDGFINAYELKDVLNQSTKNMGLEEGGFSTETCRSLVACMDDDRSGVLGVDEFTELWTLIINLKAVFNQFDQDKSGKLGVGELRGALAKAGLKVSTKVLCTIARVFASRSGDIEFDDFIVVFCRLRSIFQFYQNGGKNSSLDDMCLSMMTL